MANFFVCDKCGYSCGNAKKFIYIRAYKSESAAEYDEHPIKSMDVCKDCYKKILKCDFFENKIPDTSNIKYVSVGVLELLSDRYGLTYEINDGVITGVNF